MPSINYRIAKAIVWNMLISLFAFYAGCFLAASISHGFYRLNKFSASAPFDFNNWVDLDRCCAFSEQSKINLISMVGGYGSLLFCFITATRKAHWLFTLIVTVLHVVISCIVIQSFPLSYSYWLSLGVSSFVCLAVADIITFFITEQRFHVTVSPENDKKT